MKKIFERSHMGIVHAYDIRLPPTIVYFTIHTNFDTNLIEKKTHYVARGPWAILGVKNHWIPSKIDPLMGYLCLQLVMDIWGNAYTEDGL